MVFAHLVGETDSISVGSSRRLFWRRVAEATALSLNPGLGGGEGAGGVVDAGRGVEPAVEEREALRGLLDSILITRSRSVMTSDARYSPPFPLIVAVVCLFWISCPVH